MAKWLPLSLPKKSVSFPQKKKTLSEKFWNVKVLKSMLFFVVNQGSFYHKTLISKPQKCTFLANLFFSKNPKIPKDFLIGKVSFPSPFLLKSVCEKRLGHIVTNKFTKLRNKFEVSWKTIIVCYFITLWEKNKELFIAQNINLIFSP